MTKKLKNIGSNKKIEKDNLEKQGRICAQFPTFSFKKKLYINYMRELRKYQNKIGYIGAR